MLIGCLDSLMTFPQFNRTGCYLIARDQTLKQRNDSASPNKLSIQGISSLDLQ